MTFWDAIMLGLLLPPAIALGVVIGMCLFVFCIGVIDVIAKGGLWK